MLLLLFQQKKKEEAVEEEPEDLPHAGGLIGILGEAVYKYLDTPKHRFYLYWSLGVSLDERVTVLCVALLCNALYGVLVIVGFWVLPRHKMLVATALTLAVGPAIILILLGIVGAAIAMLALYPMWSVVALWTYFFLKSKAFQALGLYFELDVDKDGDVDGWDLIEALAKTRLGKFLRLDKLHELGNTRAAQNLVDLQRTILAKVDHIAKKLEEVENTTTTTK